MPGFDYVLIHSWVASSNPDIYHRHLHLFLSLSTSLCFFSSFLSLSLSLRCSVYTFDLHILTNVLWHLTRIESGIEWNHARQKGVALLTLCWLCWLSVKTFAVSPRRVLWDRGGKRVRVGKAVKEVRELKKGQQNNKSRRNVSRCARKSNGFVWNSSELSHKKYISHRTHIPPSPPCPSLLPPSPACVASQSPDAPVKWAKLKCVKMRNDFRFDFVKLILGHVFGFSFLSFFQLFIASFFYLFCWHHRRRLLSLLLLFLVLLLLWLFKVLN